MMALLNAILLFDIPKEEFERWYRSQSRYRTAADRERDREIEAQTISIPEMAKLLGIPRKNVYGILDCKKYRDCFVIERVADRPRITKKSFKAWLKSQSTYQLQKSKKETHEEPPLKLQCPKNGKYYSFQEIQAFYGISRPTLDSWVLKEGIPTMKLGRVKRIQKEAFDEVLKSKRKVEEDVLKTFVHHTSYGCMDWFTNAKQVNIRRETYTSQLMKGGHFTMNLPLFISSANFLLMKSLLLVLFRGLCSLLGLTAQQKIH